MNELAPTEIIFASSSAFKKEAAPEGRKYDRTIARISKHTIQTQFKRKECSPYHVQETPQVGRTTLFFRDVNSGPHEAHTPSLTDTSRNLSLVAVNEVKPMITCIQDVFETENNFVLRPRLSLKR